MKLSDEQVIEIMQGVIDLYFKPNFIELGMDATGQWLNSLEARCVDGNGEIWGMDYTYWLANGRKPGVMPPVSSLIPWVNAKMGIGGKEANSIAWAIAIKIKNEGTSYYPNGTDLLEVLTSKEVTDYVYEKAGLAFSTEINKILKKQLDDNFA